MSVQFQLRRDVPANLAAFVGAVGEPIYDTTNRRLLLNDGLTPNGIPVNAAYGPLGSFLQPNTLEGLIETITTGGTTYTSSLQIPAGVMLIGVCSLVEAAITGCTAFELGISGTAAKFATGLAVAAASFNAALVGPFIFTSATPILVTSTAGGNFTGGSIRFAIQYLTIGAPLS